MTINELREREYRDVAAFLPVRFRMASETGPFLYGSRLGDGMRHVWRVDRVAVLVYLEKAMFEQVVADDLVPEALSAWQYGRVVGMPAHELHSWKDHLFGYAVDLDFRDALLLVLDDVGLIRGNGDRVRGALAERAMRLVIARYEAQGSGRERSAEGP